MKKTLLLSLVVVIILGLYFWSPFEGQSKASVAENPKKESPRVKAANAFIKSLSEDLKADALFEFTDEERFNWHFIPREREGLDLRKMNQDQREKAFALLASYLSDEGIAKAKSVMSLEGVLKILENRKESDDTRDPEKYFFSIFGTPTDDQPWGWRMEGHHLSFNFTSVSNEISVTPAFMGANPGKVPSGEKKGLRVLRAEEDMGRAFVKSLTSEQQKTAIISKEAPDEVVTGAARKASLEKFEGIKFNALNASQQKDLQALLDLYLGMMEKDIAKVQFKKVMDAGGLESLYFAWAGDLEVGDRHYYRIHGPTILIEYDNTQNDANHVHVVWRDLTDDFGEDLLAKHYQTSGSGHGHGTGHDH